MNEALSLLFLAVMGTMAGFINILAGGGSLVAIAGLLWIGVPSTEANAINRFAVAAQGATAVLRFHRHGEVEWREARIVTPWVIIGSVVGSLSVINISERVFDFALSAIVALVVIMIFIPSEFWRRETKRSISYWLQAPAFFALGVYAGFVQAGFGLLAMPTIMLLRGRAIARANALKSIMLFSTALISCVIFAANGSIDWRYSIALACGGTLGASLAVRVSLRHGAKSLRWALALVALLTMIRLIGLPFLSGA